MLELSPAYGSPCGHLLDRVAGRDQGTNPQCLLLATASLSGLQHPFSSLWTPMLDLCAPPGGQVSGKAGVWAVARGVA